MKDGVYFINTARGKIVDEDALVDALKSGKVKMAGLDVFPNEPEIKYVVPSLCLHISFFLFLKTPHFLYNQREPERDKLTQLLKIFSPYYITSDKVIIQPHVGGLTDGAFSLSERECFENIKACLSTGTPIAPINFVERTSWTQGRIFEKKEKKKGGWGSELLLLSSHR